MPYVTHLVKIARKVVSKVTALSQLDQLSDFSAPEASFKSFQMPRLEIGQARLVMTHDWDTDKSG